jgi:hypothetical protein
MGLLPYEFRKLLVTYLAIALGVTCPAWVGIRKQLLAAASPA